MVELGGVHRPDHVGDLVDGVASLACVSIDYYARLERGNLAGVSQGVLDALYTALPLDDA